MPEPVPGGYRLTPDEFAWHSAALDARRAGASPPDDPPSTAQAPAPAPDRAEVIAGLRGAIGQLTSLARWAAGAAE